MPIFARSSWSFPRFPSGDPCRPQRRRHRSLYAVARRAAITPSPYTPGRRAGQAGSRPPMSSRLASCGIRIVRHASRSSTASGQDLRPHTPLAVKGSASSSMKLRRSSRTSPRCSEKYPRPHVLVDLRPPLPRFAHPADREAAARTASMSPISRTPSIRDRRRRGESKSSSPTPSQTSPCLSGSPRNSPKRYGNLVLTSPSFALDCRFRGWHASGCNRA